VVSGTTITVPALGFRLRASADTTRTGRSLSGSVGSAANQIWPRCGDTALSLLYVHALRVHKLSPLELLAASLLGQ
jgi:hypothetical protein